jgi:hypothetical protein
MDRVFAAAIFFVAIIQPGSHAQKEGEIVSLQNEASETREEAMGLQNDMDAQHETIIRLEDYVKIIGSKQKELSDTTSAYLSRIEESLQNLVVVTVDMKAKQSLAQAEAKAASEAKSPSVTSILIPPNPKSSNRGPIYSRLTSRRSVEYLHPNLGRYFSGAALVTADLKLPKDLNFQKSCRIGGTAGWGHRLERASQAFVHLIWNEKTIIRMQWGHCIVSTRACMVPFLRITS